MSAYALRYDILPGGRTPDGHEALMDHGTIAGDAERCVGRFDGRVGQSHADCAINGQRAKSGMADEKVHWHALNDRVLQVCIIQPVQE